MNNKPKVSVELLQALDYGEVYDEYEYFLDSLNIEYEEDDNLEQLVCDILDKYEFVDSKLDYYDLEKSYAHINIYFKYNNQYWESGYYDSPYSNSDECDEPILVEPYEETVINYRPIC